jgi:hypothetical protein
MAKNDNRVRYKRPPAHSQFKKGQSGNPSGRPKKRPDFPEDAIAILGAPVTGHANGKEITLPAAQAMFRRLCQKALKGDNAALRWVFDLILTLEPDAQRQAGQNAVEVPDARRKLAKMAGIDLDAPDDGPEEPDPRMEEFEKQADALAREERKRRIRETKKRQHSR